MWNMPYSPATFAKMTPRERMHASLSGFGNERAAVEVRGAAGDFRALVQSTVRAPRVGSLFTGGALHANTSGKVFDAHAARSLNTPISVANAQSAIPQVQQVVRGLGAVAPALDRVTVLNIPGLRRGTVTPVAPPSTVTPVGSGGRLPSPAMPVTTGSGGAVSTEPDVRLSPDAPVLTREPAVPVEPQPLPGDVVQSEPVVSVTLTSPPAVNTGAATAATSGIAPWKLAVGAAVLFGGIWYATRKG